MDLQSMSDGELIDELHQAQKSIPGLASHRNETLAAWKIVIDLTRELERRYPPVTEPLT